MSIVVKYTKWVQEFPIENSLSLIKVSYLIKFDSKSTHPMKISILLATFFIVTTASFSQTNIKCTSPLGEEVMKGVYNASQFDTSGLAMNKNELIDHILKGVNSDSLKEYIIKLSTFKTRHTSSDTVSNTTGIGAARRWAFEKFKSFSPGSNNRLIPAYLQFDQMICGVGQHRNTIAVLPGTDPSIKDIILVEGHLDSRCDQSCDVNCTAEGVEDNATGSALVLELCRVLSKTTFKRTIVFMLTIGEEQGLLGANAFAQYTVDKDINVRAVFNNDVIGSIVCGASSSPPSCPGENLIDSTQVRIFSFGGFNSSQKQLARYSKLQYTEELLPVVKVPMLISIMSAEDRTGRGGDHIPFRRKGIASIRYTSSHEHGDASNGVGYTDRQHTSEDILGVDTDNDKVIDSFFVDFNYLARNSRINAVSMVMAANGPTTPKVELNMRWGRNLLIEIKDPIIAPRYRIAVRSTSNDWDTLYQVIGKKNMDIWIKSGANQIVSVAAVDDNKIESLFTGERSFTTSGIDDKIIKDKDVVLMANKPNPFDESTIISVELQKSLEYTEAHIAIQDISGKIIGKIPVKLEKGLNEFLYEHGYGVKGVYMYSLIVDGKALMTERMIFAN